ncbi:MAG: hypothetical protein KA165_17765 [Saprospiraceae bacterium]|nr:hypothetical protein [Saprospiraceae bacterium]
MAYLYDECFGKDESELRIFQEKSEPFPVKSGKTQEKAVFGLEKNLKELHEIAALLPNL